MNKIITILGSCRQDSLYNDPTYIITKIKEDISYPHYSKEILEVIRFCKYGHVPLQDTMYVFRTAIINKQPLIWTNDIKNEFNTTDLFIIEIASKLSYEYNGFYLHHISVEDMYNTPCKKNIIIRKQTKEEIELDILNIKIELNSKPFIIVSHICTYKHGERYNLTQWLEEICIKHNIPFINPTNEFKKNNIDILSLLNMEPTISHYNNEGHLQIKKIYDNFIQTI